jgi:hypothetical protein
MIWAMRSRSAMTVSTFRNLLISGGAYYLSWWVAYPFGFVYGKATGWIVYNGDFGAAIVMPLITSLPYALVAAGVGASVALLVESKRPLQWVVLAAALYAYYAYFGQRWNYSPTITQPIALGTIGHLILLNRIGQVMNILFPATTCIVGAVAALRYRKFLSQTSSPSPG